jgi:dipeptidyl aminopeptidase/acylaminoacyl peptidase
MKKKGSIVVLLLTSFFLSSALGQDERKSPATIEDILQLKAIVEVRLSPDGSQVAFVTREVDFEFDRYRTQVRIISAQEGKSLYMAEGSRPRWAPDGKSVAYLSGTQIRRVSLPGGTAEKIIEHPRTIRELEYSPDGRSLAFLADHDPKRSENDPIEVDVTGYAQWFPDGFSWSPDSQRITFGRRPNANRPGAYLFSDLMTVELDSGKLEYLVRQEGMDGNPRWSPQGNQVAFIRTPHDWVRVSGLHLVPPGGGEGKLLSGAFDEHVKQFHWSRDGRKIYFVGGAGVSTQIFSLDVPSGNLLQLTQDADVYGSLSISRDGRTAAFTRQNATTPEDIYIASLELWEPRRVTDLNPQTTSWKLGSAEAVRWPSFDGMEIEGLVYKPPQYRKGQRLPFR